MSGSKPRAFSAASRRSTKAMSLREYERKTFACEGSPLSRPTASVVMAQAVGVRLHGGCIAREIASSHRWRAAGSLRYPAAALIAIDSSGLVALDGGVRPTPAALPHE